MRKRTAAGLSKTSVPANAVDAINFTLGLMDIVSVIVATMIGRGVFEPNAFQKDVKKYAKLWREKGLPSRAIAAETFGERLKAIELGKVTANELAGPERPRLN